MSLETRAHRMVSVHVIWHRTLYRYIFFRKFVYYYTGIRLV